MANPEHVAMLKQGVEAWNQWRERNPDLTPDLRDANLKGLEFRGSFVSVPERSTANRLVFRKRIPNMRGVNLRGADLRGANFARADFRGAELTSGPVFTELGGKKIFEGVAQLQEANLQLSDFRQVFLYGADLHRANLSGADFRGTDLREATLVGTTMVGTKIQGADLRGASVFGCSVWEIELDNKTKQTDLVITQVAEPTVTCDNLEIAQFLYLILNNEKLGSVLETLTTKVVLLLGRFKPERKEVLDSLREALRRKGYVPVMFDFDKPASKSVAGTVATLARMARFVIADVTDPNWVTVETHLIIRESRTVPFQIIAQEDMGQIPGPIADLFPEVGEQLLSPFWYRDVNHVANSVEAIVRPAEQLVKKFLTRRREIEKNPWQSPKLSQG